MTFLKPVWKTEKKEHLAEAITAVHRTNDPKKLYEIALNAYFPEVQSEALQQLQDPQLLKEIILAPTTSYEIRHTAVSRITDPAVLAEIAMQRQAYPADGEAIARLSDQTLLKKIALSEQGGEQDKAVYRITGQHDLAEIAVSAKKAGARKTAIRNIDDPDILMDIIEASEEGYTRTEAHARLKNLQAPPRQMTFTDRQRERYLDLIIGEEDRNVHIDLFAFSRAEELDRIFREAARYDLKAAALSCLVLNEDYSADSLLAHWKIAEEKQKTVHNTFANPWQDARKSIEDRLDIEEINRPSLLLDFVSDPEVGSAYAARCLGSLFDEKFQSYEEIGTLRDESFAAFLRNIPAYARQDEVSDMKKYLLMLTEAIPEVFRERYGLSVFAEEYDPENK